MENLDKIFNVPISEMRSKIIDDAVKIEFIIDGIVASTFGIEVKNALSVGNRSSALSFIQKINLLFDIKFVQKEHKPKFLCLAEIRNQFAHDLNTSKIGDCKKEYIDKLKKFYPSSSKETPVPYIQLYNNLYEDVKKYSELLFELIQLKAAEKGSILGLKKFYEIMNIKVGNHLEKDPEFSNTYLMLWESAKDEFERTPLKQGEEIRPIL